MIWGDLDVQARTRKWLKKKRRRPVLKPIREENGRETSGQF
jgi:hypothetical protein